jgi:hypothetical protein
MKGWRYESHRHMLAAKGISTQRRGYFARMHHVEHVYKENPTLYADTVSNVLNRYESKKEDVDVDDESAERQLDKRIILLEIDKANKQFAEGTPKEYIHQWHEDRQSKIDELKEQRNDQGFMAKKKKEVLIGGKGDNKPDFLFNKEEMKKGVKEEREHTKNLKIRKEITKDHLVEDPKYYTHMSEWEKDQHKAERFVHKLGNEKPKTVKEVPEVSDKAANVGVKIFQWTKVRPLEFGYDEAKK